VASIEETAIKTNMVAAEEAARQMRLRDLAGLIVIDFIDMEDRRNNAAVEKKLKDKLKTDRARIQVGRISPFGLLEMSRQRLRPGMIEATTKACPHCHGTGRVRSDDSMALALLREVEEEGVRQRSKEVLIVAPVEIANYLLNQKREHVAMIEARFGLSVRVEGDASLVSPDYRLERFKTASRIIPAPQELNLPTVAYPEEEIEEEEAPEEEEAAAAETAAGERSSGKRKRRRRRRGGKGGQEQPATFETSAAAPDEPDAETAPSEAQPAEEPAEPQPKSRRRSRSRGALPPREAAEPEAAVAEAAVAEAAVAEAAEPVAAPPAPAAAEIIDLGDEPVSEIVEVPEADAPQRRRRERVRKPVTAVLAEVISDAVAAVAPRADEREDAAPPEAPEASAPEAEPEAPPERADEGPKRRGWWSRALGS
jgi:ribonuclease E